MLPIMRMANRVLGICSILLSIVIFCLGKSMKLAFFSGYTPGPGFLPYVVSCGIAIFGAIILAGSFLGKADAGEEKSGDVVLGIFQREEIRNFVSVIGTSILVVATAPYLGLLTSMGIGVAAIAKLLGTPGWKGIILLGIGSTIVFYLIFSVFLSVPLPKGPLGF